MTGPTLVRHASYETSFSPRISQAPATGNPARALAPSRSACPGSGLVRFWTLRLKLVYEQSGPGKDRS